MCKCDYDCRNIAENTEGADKEDRRQSRHTVLYPYRVFQQRPHTVINF